MVIVIEEPGLSPAVEDYLKAIYHLSSHGEHSGQAIAERLGVAQASVTAMCRRLQEQGLVDWAPYRPISLTPRGQQSALAVIRRHRILETFLHEVLDMPWDEVHEEAEVLEHHISPRLLERMADRLGDPHFDPHGDPIPAADGTLPESDTHPLAGAAPNATLTVHRVRVSRPEVLRYLDGIGIRPGARIAIIERAPFAGPVTVGIEGGARHALDQSLAQQIEVSQEPGRALGPRHGTPPAPDPART